MKFDYRKDVGLTKIYRFTNLNFTEKLELKFVLKDEIWVVIFLKDGQSSLKFCR